MSIIPFTIYSMAIPLLNFCVYGAHYICTLFYIYADPPIECWANAQQIILKYALCLKNLTIRKCQIPAVC